MSKRPTAKQAANEPYWFAKDQEVSKAVTPITDPEFKVEFDGKETYVMCNGVALAFRRDNRWVSIEPGITVRSTINCFPLKLGRRTRCRNLTQQFRP